MYDKWTILTSKYKYKKINILEIGVYEGDSTKWFLTNVMGNKDSLLYAVDTFDRSPDFSNINLKKIKKQFITNIKSTKKEQQVKLMETYSYDALVELSTIKNIRFDIVFIETSDQAIHLISDAVLAWNMLNTGGIMIFGNYSNNLLINELSKPLIAVNSFIEIMKPTLNILHKETQIFIEKKELDIANIPVSLSPDTLLNEVNRLFNDIKYFTINIGNLQNSSKIESKLTKLISTHKGLIEDITVHQKNILNIPTLLISSMNYNIEFYNVNPLFNILTEKYNIQCKNNSNIEDKYKRLNDILLDRSRDNKFIKLFNDFYYSDYYTTNSLVILVQKSNMKKKNITLLQFKHLYDFTGQFQKEEETDFFKSKVRLIGSHFHPKIKYNTVEVSCSLRYFKNENIYKSTNENNYNQLNLNSVDNLLHLIKRYESQIDLLNIGYTSLNNINYNDSECTSKMLYRLIVFTLCTQSENGSACIQICNKLDSNMYNIIHLLSKYYKDIVFNIPKSLLGLQNCMILEATNFKGISKNDINKFINSLTSNKFEINSQISVNYYTEQLYSLYSSELDIIKRLNSICSELKKHKYKDLLEQVEHHIYNKQVEYLFDWINSLFTDTHRSILSVDIRSFIKDTFIPLIK